MSDVLKENDDSKEEIVIVEDQADLSDNDDGQDERSARRNDDEVGDERLSIQERRRQEKMMRKQRRDDARNRDQVELDFLRKRNDDLERRMSAQEHRAHSLDLSAFDGAISKAAQEAEMADRVIAKAVAAGNGEDVTQAMRYRDQAIARIQQLNFQKMQVAQQRPQPQQIDDLTLHHAQEFIKENPWYDAQGRDEDSAIVIAIDQSLAKEGFNPQSADYWDELKRRAAKRLPERFDGDAPKRSSERAESRREPRGGPAVGSGREHAPTSTRKEIYISPERKQALIEAGVWDDPVLRNRYVARYAEYDRQNRS
jgi:hypothetical protein